MRSIRAYQARNAPLRSGVSAPFGVPRRRFLAGGRSVTGHGAGIGGAPRAPWDPVCEPGVLGRRCSAPPQDRLMMAPLIERNASVDTCCLLFVNNFNSRVGTAQPWRAGSRATGAQVHSVVEDRRSTAASSASLDLIHRAVARRPPNGNTWTRAVAAPTSPRSSHRQCHWVPSRRGGA